MDIKDFGKLIRGITSNVNFYISVKIEKYGIRQGQFEYFLLIYSNPGINQLDLARLKNVGKASVTKALKILEDHHFILRKTDEKDKRNTQCYITNKGEKIVDNLINVTLEAEDKLFKDFKNEDKLILYKYLSKMHDNSETLFKSINDETE